MSRTENTMPMRLQYEDGAIWFQEGGRWRGLGKVASKENRRERRRSRILLRTGRGEHVDQHRHSAKYFMY